MKARRFTVSASVGGKPGLRAPRGAVNHSTVWLLLALFVALLGSTLLAYQPAWHGGLLWDDDGHITPSVLSSRDGLWAIWFEVGATQQYYPLLHTLFWLLHIVWGDNTLGYHLVNILLHACSALLIAVILRRLRVPGAVLASVIFALHPVQVESVAWISEMKNTLSGVFYLGAALAYLGFDATRHRRRYVIAIFLYGLALLSKSLTATLPAGLALLVWWRRGRLRWREDIVPLVPFLLLGAAAGLMTMWVERTFIGAQGAEFDFSVVDRFLIAGRAMWFYLSKLLWPVHLVFIYPQWRIDPQAAWQYLFPLGVAGLFLALWLLRTRWRAPFAGLGFFGVTLGPALGFVNVFPFRYSFVADHFQYLASIAIIVLFSAGIAMLISRWRLNAYVGHGAALLAIGLPLGVLSWTQSHQYVNAATLYRATIAANPSCWLAHNNLGILLQRSGRLEEARVEYEQALRIEPKAFEAHQNMGVVLQSLGRPAEAVGHARQALLIRRDYPEAHNSLGAALHRLGQHGEAIASFRQALRLRPEYPEALANLGAALDAVGQTQDAITEYQRVISLEPGSADAQYMLADALRRSGHLPDAIRAYEAALRLNPKLAEALNDLGLALEAQGRFTEAQSRFEDAATLLPRSAKIQNNIGRILMLTGQPREAVARFLEALRLQADYAPARRNYADVLVRSGRPEEGLAQYRLALESQPDSAETRCNMGVALVQLGRLDDALAEFTEALRLRPDFALARENLTKALALRKQPRHDD